MTDFVRDLRDTPFFWSRLGFCYDPPRAGADGRQIIFSREFDEYNRVHRGFAKASVIYHTTILHSGWVADGKYDYTLTDETLDAVFDGNPDIYYMPRVKLNVPPDWCRTHPEDTFVYYTGPRDPKEIAALAETADHDYFGFRSGGYSVNGGKGVWKDDRPNPGDKIGLQSFSSLRWVEDASETLRRLLKHLAESKYRDRILGVHVAYGMCGETNLWGAWSPIGEGRRGDWGVVNRKRFIEYGVKKYGSEEAAEKVWGTLEPPAPFERQETREKLADQFFPENSHVRDYFDFVSKTNADAIEAYCKCVKDCSSLFGRELAAGVFYGYMYLPQSMNAGHLAIEQIVKSPYVDFLSSPKGYYRCLAGDPGGEQGPSESVALEKAWLDEIDCHTHLDRRPDGRAANLFESETLLWREAVKNLTHGQGFWWMDLGEGWYDCPELMEDIRTITELQKRIRPIERRSAAEVLLVVDERSLGASSISYGLNHGLMYELHSELKLIGAPADTLRLCDLYRVDLSQYKLVVFANCFTLAAGEREKLLALLDGKTVVWHYAAGILAPDYDEANYTALTGFTLREIPRPDDAFIGYEGSPRCNKAHQHVMGDFPLFTIEADGMEVLKRYPTGEVMAAMKGNVCAAACPCLGRGELRMLAKRAGVKILCDADCAVFADNRIIGFFPKDDFKGTLSLPHPVNGKTQLDADIPAHGRLVLEFDRP